MKKIQKIAKAITILILTISFFGCNNDDNILPQLTAGYTFTVIEDAGIVTFINVSDDAIKYVWDFGDGTTSTEINPIKSFTTGTYNVVLTATNAAGASDSFESEITILRKGPASLPLNFDEAAVKYNFAAFNGASFKIVANPDVSGSNNVASNVGAITNIGAEYEGITFDLATPIDLTADKSIKINVWSDKVVDVLVKMENGTASDIESIVSHGGSGWETLTFDYSSSASYFGLTIFIDGPGKTAGTFYIDDVMQIQTPAPLCTAETIETLSAAGLNMTFKSDLTANFINDGANFKWVTNPKSDAGINTSCKVGQITKLGNNPWDNNQIILDGKLDFNTNAGLKIKVYSAKAGFKVRVKLEDKANAGTNTELEVTTTKTNEWEELTFPFASTHSGKFDKIVLFFDLNANNKDVYYFDDLTLYGTGSGTGSTACTTEAAESIAAASLNITFKTDQTANVINDGATFSWVSNPDSNNAINSSCYVGKITKLGNNPWDNNQINLSAKLDFNANAGLKIKVFSAKAGFKVRIKLEEKANAGNNTELEVATTKTNAWEELTFPFASTHSGKFDKIVLFFDLNANNKDVYYFDDLTFYGTGSGSGTGGTPATGDIAQNGGFETGNLDGWAVYKNGGIIIADNTTSKTGTWSAKLYASPSGLNPTLKQERKAAGGIKVGDKVKITFDYKGALTGESGAYSIQSFVEAANGVNQVINMSVNPTSTWQTFTTTYTVAAGDVSGGITTEFVAICGGVAGCSSTLYLDNVSVVINP